MEVGFDINAMMDAKYKFLVSEHFGIDKIVLFGSYAKDNAREDSDIVLP